MGVMKTARTAMTLRMFPTSREDQLAIKSLIAREEQYREHQYAEGQERKEKDSDRDLIEPVYMRTSYVGRMPQLEGQYIVVDLATKARSLVTIRKLHGALWVYPAGEPPLNLASYSLRSYRWLRLSTLLPQDVAALRELPAVQEPSHEYAENAVCRWRPYG